MLMLTFRLLIVRLLQPTEVNKTKERMIRMIFFCMLTSVLISPYL